MDPGEKIDDGKRRGVDASARDGNDDDAAAERLERNDDEAY